MVTSTTNVGDENSSLKEYYDKIGFNVQKYNQLVDDTRRDLYTYLHANDLANKNLNHLEKELNVIQECFTQLKYNYIEIGSKQLFIHSIVSNNNVSDENIQSPSQDTITGQENQIAKGKKTFKEIKENNTKIMNEISKLINDIVEADQNLQKEKDNITNLLNISKQKIHGMFEMNESINSMISKDFASLSVNDKLNAKIDWFKKFEKVLEKLNGWKILNHPKMNNMNNNNNNNNRMDIDMDNQKQLIIELDVGNNHKVEINITLDSTLENIESVRLTPPFNQTITMHVQGLAEDYCNVENDLTDLIQEISFTLGNYHKRDTEIELLSSKFHIQRCDEFASIIKVDLPSRHSCSITLDLDYPSHTESCIYINTIEKNNIPMDMDSLNQVQSQLMENNYTLSQLLNVLIAQLK